jgi:two-component system cell cycle response regulator
LYLPINLRSIGDDESDVARALLELRSAPATQVERLHLLIIEDDPDQRELIRETLEERFGAGTVSAAGSRAEAMQQDLSAFDLILSDYNLPDATGMQLLEDIQKRCNTPVIMVTGENVGRIAAEAIRKGATDYVVKFGDYLFTIPLVIEKNLAVAKVRRENARLNSELERALREVQEKNVQLEKSLKRIEEVAATDPLTGLYNRRHFGRVIEQLFNEAQRYDNGLSCVMIDLDGYKQLNDKFGHQIGDQLLVVAGKVISANMRKMDVAARYGGDEFIVLLPRAEVDEAAGVAQRIRDEFRQGSAILLRRNEGVSMSIGISSMRGDRPVGTEQLIAAADAALYRAKAAGRNRVELSVGSR